MDIFEFALEKEKFAENYYRDLSEKTENTGLKKVLLLLADEEQKHYDIIQALRQKNAVKVESDLFPSVKTIFLKMKSSKEKFDFNLKQLELYDKALEFEKTSLNFYSEKATQAQDEKEKEVLLKLCGEEKKHIVLIESIMDFISKPDFWMENAEFFHVEDF